MRAAVAETTGREMTGQEMIGDHGLRETIDGRIETVVHGAAAGLQTLIGQGNEIVRGSEQRFTGDKESRAFSIA